MCCKKYIKSRCSSDHIRCFLQWHFVADFRSFFPNFGYCRLSFLSTMCLRSVRKFNDGANKGLKTSVRIEIQLSAQSWYISMSLQNKQNYFNLMF